MTMSYGYGTSVSIMQMVSAVSALANDGVRVTPHVIKYSPEEDTEKLSIFQQFLLKLHIQLQNC